MKVTVTADATDLKLYIDDIEKDSVALAGASASDNGTGWRLLMQGVPYADYYTHTVNATLQATYLPTVMLTGNTLVDETNAFDGEIAWGSNTDGFSVIYGAMTSSEMTYGSSEGAYELPSGTLPDTWFAAGENIPDLPFYDSFSGVASDIGMPVQTIYFWAVIGLAFSVALFLIIFTKSALFGVLGMIIVLFVGSSQTIVPMWIPFVVLIVDVLIMYLYRQVSY